MYYSTFCGMDVLGMDSWWEARFSPPIITGTWAHRDFCITGIGFFSRRQSGRDVALTTHPQLAPKFSKVWSCTFAPPISLHSLYWIEIYLLLCIYSIYKHMYNIYKYIQIIYININIYIYIYIYIYRVRHLTLPHLIWQ